MKLKSKNSFLKRISCIALSLMLCLTSFTLAGFAPTLEAEAAELPETVSRFETDMAQMANGTVMYQSVKPAYEAYVNYFNTLKSLCEGKSADLATAANNLKKAVDTMESNRFSAPTGTFTNYLGTTKVFIDAENSSNADYKKIYKNVLYLETGLTNKDNSCGASKLVGFASGESGYKTDDKVFIPESTLLYNGGETPQVAAMYALWGNDKPWNYNWKTLRVFCCYVSNTTDIGFAGNWKGYDGRLNQTYVWFNRNELSISGTGDTTKTYYNQGTSDECFYTNVLQVKKSFSESDPLINTYTPTFNVRVGHDKKNALGTIPGSKVIRVVNYKNVIGRIKNAEKKYYANVSNYRQGGLRDYIRVIDEIKAKNPNDYFSTTSNDYDGLVTYYDNIFRDLDWFNAKADSDVNHADSSYDWTVTKEATCTETGSKNGVCRYCGATTTATIDALGHNYKNQGISGDKATVLCSKCGHHYELDYSAYKAELKVLDSMLAQTNKYTNIAECQTERDTVNKNAAAPDVLTREQVDDKVNKIKDIENKLIVATYTVTFNKVDSSGKTENISKESYKYGTVVALKAKNVAPYKWMIGNDQKVATATDEFSLVVTGDVTVNAHYLSETASVPEKQRLVTVYNRQGKIVGYLYVDDGKQLSVTADGISDGTTTVKPEKLPFYQITGYTVEGGADANGYTVTSNIKVYANYSAQPTIEITLASSTPAIYFSNDTTKSETTKTVVWDQKVTVKADEEVIWLVDGKAVAKGTSYTFRASDSITISTQGIATETPSSVITYAAFDAGNNKARLAVSNYSSDKFKIKEQGIIFGTTTNMDATLTVEQLAQKGKKYVATKTTDTGDQFSYSLTFTSTTKKKLCVISYVTYNDGTTVYSDTVTYVTIN